jgi:hypothetical protein
VRRVVDFFRLGSYLECISKRFWGLSNNFFAKMRLEARKKEVETILNSKFNMAEEDGGANSNNQGHELWDVGSFPPQGSRNSLLVEFFSGIQCP